MDNFLQPSKTMNLSRGVPLIPADNLLGTCIPNDRPFVATADKKKIDKQWSKVTTGSLVLNLLIMVYMPCSVDFLKENNFSWFLSSN